MKISRRSLLSATALMLIAPSVALAKPSVAIGLSGEALDFCNEIERVCRKTDERIVDTLYDFELDFYFLLKTAGDPSCMFMGYELVAVIPNEPHGMYRMFCKTDGACDLNNPAVYAEYDGIKARLEKRNIKVFRMDETFSELCEDIKSGIARSRGKIVEC